MLFRSIWIIDPIDGTTNYFRFGKDYAISLALYLDKKPIFGLIYDVANNRIYSEKDGVDVLSSKNGQIPLWRRDEKTLKEAVVAMSLRTMKELTGQGMDVFHMLSSAQAHRYLGCASLELCRVAHGEYDLFISSNVYEWDIAAARIYIEQSGGFILSLKKDINEHSDGKLFVAAFKSLTVWEEASQFFPEHIKNNFVLLGDRVCLE